MFCRFGILFDGQGKFILALLIFFILSLSVLPYPTLASHMDIEKDLQKSLEENRTVVKKAKDKAKSGESPADEMNQLKAGVESIKASHLLLLEKFRSMEEGMKNIGPKALERHQAMSETYKKAIDEYLNLIDSLPPPGQVSEADIDKVETYLDKILHKKRIPILGSLPYRNLNYPSREPSSDSPIKPAYKGGNKAVSPDDTKSTNEAPISEEIATLAQSLNWNPVSIYEYVKNNIETEWYWGCMKGAEETLRQKSGNDCDQATLLTALLRSSGFPSRYVRGVMEFPSLDQAKNLTGIDDPSKIAEFFQKTGIPHKLIIAAGNIANFQIEHVWVESLIPYSNYRGAIIDEHGKTWLGLDTSIKVTGYAYNAPLNILQELSLDGLRDEYLGAVRTETPLEYTKTYIETYLNQKHPGMTYNDLLQTKTLIPEVMNILPASMQYDQIAVTHEYTDIPDDLKHTVRFTASDTNNNELFALTIDALQLSNRKITVSYEPETVEDQEIIDSYGGLGNTPAYLVRLRPVLKVDEDMVVAGKDGLPAGMDYDLTLELVSPSGTERITNTQITANLSSIGIVAGKAIIPEAVSEEEKDAETILHEETINYIDRWNHAEDELASLLHLTFTRPIPTVTTIGGVIDVTYLLDVPHGCEFKGIYVDATVRAVETVVAHGNASALEDRQKTFMELSALQGSILENRIFEDDFKVESMSTAKFFQVVNSQSANVQLITIDKTNIDTILPSLPYDDNIKDDITNAVNQNFAILIPNAETNYQDWTGIGYLKENLSTGEAGYMLTGMIAGGMTVWGIDKWPAYYADRLKNPYAEPSNYDPASARYIQKLAVTDLQFGEAGSLLVRDLMVKVTDQKGKAVAQAEVIFRVKAGGGKLINKVTNSENDVLSAWTDISGIAAIRYRLGKETKTNPAFFFLDAKDIYPTQVGENIIEASLGSNGVATPKPFTEYGKPGKPSQMLQTHGDGTWGFILSFAGFVSVVMKDGNNNPIANLPVTFQALDAKANDSLPNCSDRYFDTTRGTLLTTTGDPCVKKAPIYGECPGASSGIDKILTTGAGTAMAEVILGGTPDAIYPITATCTDPKCSNLSVTFNLYTYYHDDCNLTDAPKTQLFATYVYSADPFGNNIDAGRTGTNIPVQARLYYLKEGTKEADETLSCSGVTLICKKIVGDRSYSAGSDFASSTATFAGVQGMSKGNGIFASTYTLAPGLNEIQIKGNGTITDKRSHNSCAGGCKVADADTITLNAASTTMKVYGVDITLNTSGNIYTDKDGYSYNDFKLDYIISPADYKPLSEAVILYKDNEMIDYISSDIGSTGSATIAKGYQFDIGSRYEAEVVLNYRSGVEIRSERITLPVGQFKIVADDDGTTPMQGAVTDGAARLRLQLFVKYNREAFAGLTWQLIDPQVMDYTPSSIRGGFISGGAVVDSLPVTFNADGAAEAVYRSPESFVRWDTLEASNDKERPERLIQPTVDLANYFKTLKDPFPPIRLKRAPVVLVHGLWGNPRVWDTFVSKFNSNSLYEIGRADYRLNNAGYFNQNAPRLDKAISSIIAKQIDESISASKVDIVSHSMGGLITRELCRQEGLRNTDCTERLRKIITIDSPHAGSELANLVVDINKNPASYPSLCPSVLPIIDAAGNHIWSDIQKTIIAGALVDLSMNSAAIRMLETANALRWNAIVGETTISGDIPGLKKRFANSLQINIMWELLYWLCQYVPDDSFFQLFGLLKPVFSESNDRIVSKSSQTARSSESVQFRDVDHFSVRNDNDVINTIKDLLENSRQ